MVMWIVDVGHGHGGYLFCFSASEIANCAGGWTGQSPRS